MHLPHTLNHRLHQSCCHCPTPHHSLHSQTPSAGEKNKKYKRGGIDVCVQGDANSWGSVHVTPFAEVLNWRMWRHSSRWATWIPAILSLLAWLYMAFVSIQAIRLACVPASLRHAAIRGAPEWVPLCSDTIFPVNPPCKHLKGLNYMYHTSTPLRQCE